MPIGVIFILFLTINVWKSRFNDNCQNLKKKVNGQKTDSQIKKVVGQKTDSQIKPDIRPMNNRSRSSVPK